MSRRTRPPEGGDSMEVSFDNPFFDEMSKYPVRFAVPVFFGDPPNWSFAASLSNGTASLLRLGNRFLAITCHHVLEGFRKRSAAGATFFQLGYVRMVPDQYVIAESSELDLAVLDLTPFIGQAAVRYGGGVCLCASLASESRDD